MELVSETASALVEEDRNRNHTEQELAELIGPSLGQAYRLLAIGDDDVSKIIVIESLTHATADIVDGKWRQSHGTSDADFKAGIEIYAKLYDYRIENGLIIREADPVDSMTFRPALLSNLKRKRLEAGPEERTFLPPAVTP